MKKGEAVTSPSWIQGRKDDKALAKKFAVPRKLCTWQISSQKAQACTQKAQAYRVRASVNQNGSSSPDVNAESNKKQQHQKAELKGGGLGEEVSIPSPSTDITSDSEMDYGLIHKSHLGCRELVAQQEKIVEAKRRDGSPKRAVDAIEKNVVEKKAFSGSGYPNPGSHVYHPAHDGLPAFLEPRSLQDFWNQTSGGPSGGPGSSGSDACSGSGCLHLASHLHHAQHAGQPAYVVPHSTQAPYPRWPVAWQHDRPSVGQQTPLDQDDSWKEPEWQ